MSSLLETPEAGNAADLGENAAQGNAASEAGKPAGAAATAVVEPQTKAEEKPEPPKPRAPEKYDFKLPEGSKIDDGLMAQFEGALRKADVPQEHANALFELGARMQSQFAQAVNEAVEAKTNAWKTAAEKLPEFSEKNRKDTAAQIRAFLSDEKVLGSEGAGTLLNDLGEGGFGVHPHLLKALAVAAKMHAEDVAVLGGRGADDKKSWKDFYDKSDHV